MNYNCWKWRCGQTIDKKEAKNSGNENKRKCILEIGSKLSPPFRLILPWYWTKLRCLLVRPDKLAATKIGIWTTQNGCYCHPQKILMDEDPGLWWEKRPHIQKVAKVVLSCLNCVSCISPEESFFQCFHCSSGFLIYFSHGLGQLQGMGLDGVMIAGASSAGSHWVAPHCALCNVHCAVHCAVYIGNCALCNVLLVLLGGSHCTYLRNENIYIQHPPHHVRFVLKKSVFRESSFK